MFLDCQLATDGKRMKLDVNETRCKIQNESRCILRCKTMILWFSADLLPMQTVEKASFDAIIGQY